MKKLLALLICGWLFAACSNDETTIEPPVDEVEEQLQQMTLREKVGQMFYIRIESLDPTIEWTTFDDLAALKNQEITTKMRQTNEQYPVGGIILYAWNIEDEAQLARIIPQIRSLKGHPLLFPLRCRLSYCKTSCAVSWATRTSSLLTAWRWGLSPSTIPVPRPLWAASRLALTSCLVPVTSWRLSMR